MVTFSKKGSILVAFIFIIVLALTTVSFLMMIGGRSAFTANQLKRAQAINYAEAALYETFNRCRAGQAGWDIHNLSAGKIGEVVIDDGHGEIHVEIYKRTTTVPYKIDAVVPYDPIRM